MSFFSQKQNNQNKNATVPCTELISLSHRHHTSSTSLALVKLGVHAKTNRSKPRNTEVLANRGPQSLRKSCLLTIARQSGLKHLH